MPQEWRVQFVGRAADTNRVRDGHGVANVVPAAVVGGPILSWLIALALLHGDGSGSTYAALFIGLPFALTLAAGLAAGRRASAVPVALLSAALAVVSWLIVAVTFASRFAS